MGSQRGEFPIKTQHFFYLLPTNYSALLLAYSIDGQVCLVHLQRTISFCFFINKQMNDKLPFARQANGKRIQENCLSFRFPFEMAAYIYT